MNRPSEPRIKPLEEPTAEQNTVLGAMLVGDKEPLNVFKTMAHHPWLLKRFGALGGQLLFRGVVGDRERELVILRVGWNCQSVYEFGQHTVIGKEAGLTDAEIAALASDGDPTQSDHAWSEGDIDLLRLADELCADDCVSDPTYASLATRWDEQALLELVICAGYYRMVSGYLNTFGVQLEPGTPGFPSAT